MAHRYLNDDALAALVKQDRLTPAPTRYRVHESIKPNTYRSFPRCETVGLTDTLVTRDDGTQYVISRNNGKNVKRTKSTTATTVRTQAQKTHDILMRLPSIHDSNDSN